MELLIAANERDFQERPAEWFEQNKIQIKKAALESLLWQRRFLFLKTDERIPLDILTRKLLELNYRRSDFVDTPGTFRQKGGFFEIFPVNLVQPVRLEFSGNAISAITGYAVERKAAHPVKKISFAFGDFVVHKDHGIGVFRGAIIEQGKQYFEIEYAPAREGGPPDRLLVPEEKSDKLSLYLGFVTPTLHRLSSPLWQNTKKKVKAAAEKFARELLELYKKRASAKRRPLREDPLIEKEVAHSFAYELTEGQKQALRDIEEDFLRDEPAERLVCADVGFGKTEVALRAAVRVASNGGQTALISPTTILAFQHFQTFSKRLENTPLSVDFLSRAQKNQKHIAEALRRGTLDIIIGTHRLLQKDIKFKNLRLLIIDEEQKFGVRQKELLKQQDPSIDILYLSATPIPRTLYLALSKVKKISMIETPPPERQSIETHIAKFHEKTIKEAIGREISRGGQVFYLHNRIDSIDRVKRDLQQLFPEISFEILHGRLNEKEMIERLLRFQEGKISILLATTIIENGLDLKNVNTLIVDDATRLGLAEAHQLRGRIGRGERKAYAYFLYQKKKLTEQGKRRLEALDRFQELGAGYQIALKDLEIRGAGNVLGKEQSGAINLVGMNLYLEILNSVLGS